MIYVKIETPGLPDSFAICTSESAQAYQANTPDGVVVTISDTPYLPQAKHTALEEAQIWAATQRIAETQSRMQAYFDGLTAISAATTVEGVASALAALTSQTSENLAGPVRAECERRIGVALGSSTVQASMLREVGFLNSQVAQGVTLTPEQMTEAAMLSVINAWESAMVDKREVLISAADPTFMDDSHWPLPPDGLAQFLTGF